MRQQKSKSNSILPKGCGCLLLAVVGVIGPLALLSIPLPANKLDPNARRDEMTTVAILCETEKRPFFIVKLTDDLDEPAEPIYQNGEVICGKGTTEVSK